jgi:hypothetical protein
MSSLITRYRAWRTHVDNNGEGPIIWWPLGRFRVYFAHESWSLPLAIHWEDSGEYAGSREVALVIGVLCFSAFIDLSNYRRYAK